MASRSTLRLTPLRRHLAAVLTIATSCAFVAIMVLAGDLMQQSLRAGAAQDYDGADLQIEPADAAPVDPSAGPRPAPEVEGAQEVWPLLEMYTLELRTPEAPSTFLPASYLPLGAEDDLVEGRAPTSGMEVVLDAVAAEEVGAGLGTELTLSGRTSPTGEDQVLTVVGIAPAPQGSAFSAQPRLMVSPANAAALLGPAEGTDAQRWLARTAPGVDPGQVAERATSEELEVITAQQAEREAAAQLVRAAGPLMLIVAVFVAIALFTSAVVIANTFSVTLAQRVRSLALLRAVGATRSQVRGVVLRESLLVSLIGSAAGMVLGHLLVQAALLLAAAVGWLDGVALLPVTAASLLLPLVAGVAITLLASLVPLRAATRVTPLQALRPEPASRRRGPGLSGVLGLIAVALGVLALTGGSVLAGQGSAGLGVLLALAGGVLSFCGLLAALVLLTRPSTALVGRVAAAVGGLPARIAAANIARNPGRSAATVGALLIGTTLMTMMAVGARSAESTLTAELDSRRPIDLVVTATQMPQDAAEQLTVVDGIDTAHGASRGDLDVGAPEMMTLYGLTPEAIQETSHRPEMAADLTDAVVLLGRERAERFGVHDGQVLQVQDAAGAPQELRVRIDANLQMSIVTPTTLEQLIGDSRTPVLLADLDDPGSVERGDLGALAVLDGVAAVLEGKGFAETSIDAGGVQRELYGQILDVLLGITVGLLGVAVLVALIGVANTLSLGVIERTGENALLRALGTTRRQMRWMLGWEGVLLAVVGALLGLLIGTVYGVLGINALLGSSYPITVEIPWLQLALVLALSVLAGALASVLPGRAAARTAPAAALADTR